MRRLIGTMAIALGFAMSGGAHAGIANSSHDFTDNCKGKSGNSATCTALTTPETGAGGWNTRGEICRVCHVPHDHGRNLYTNGLLWNHAVSTQSYTLYDSSTMDTTTQQPTGRAKMCLGCHDGTVAVSAFDSNHLSGGATPVFIGGEYSSGYLVPGSLASGDLSGTHPISIPFPDPAVDPNYTDPDVATWIGGIKVSSTLDNGLIQCSTCHDVHAQNYAFSGATYSHLLRQAQTTTQGGDPSGLCLTCHIK